MKKRIAVDLDGTLCQEGFTTERMFAIPNYDVIAKVNELYDLGHEITIFTARQHQDMRITKEWLRSHCVKHSHLVLGKVPYDYLLDDRSFQNIEDLLFQLNNEGGIDESWLLSLGFSKDVYDNGCGYQTRYIFGRLHYEPKAGCEEYLWTWDGSSIFNIPRKRSEVLRLIKVLGATK